MQSQLKVLDAMNPKLCVFSTASREGVPASAVMAYALADNGTIILSTHVGTRKYENIFLNPYASFVSGWNFSEPNIQCNGLAFVAVTEKEKKYCERMFYTQNPKAMLFKDNKTIFILFKPYWIRQTDLSKQPPKITETSLHQSYHSIGREK